jgi:SseB protein N-terminal domain
VVELTGGDERYRQDRGGADPGVKAALRAYAAGAGSEHAVLVALAGARLLVPVVAVRADQLADAAESGLPGHGADGSDRAAGSLSGQAQHVPGSVAGGGETASEMAIPAIVGRDGRRALPAFTSLDALRRWQPDARPVPAPALAVWQSAVQESQAVIIDIAGPVPVAVEGARLAALAAGGAPPAMHEDPDVLSVAARAVAEAAPGCRVRLLPPHGGLDFTLEIGPAPGDHRPVPEELGTALADAIAAGLGGRVRGGIAVLLRS